MKTPFHSIFTGIKTIFQRLLIFAAFVILVANLSVADARTWVDKKGNRLDAEYAGYEKSGTKILVKLRASKGEVKLPLTALSRKDQAFVKERINTGKGSVQPFVYTMSEIPESDARWLRVLEAVNTDIANKMRLAETGGKEMLVEILQHIKDDSYLATIRTPGGLPGSMARDISTILGNSTRRVPARTSYYRAF